MTLNITWSGSQNFSSANRRVGEVKAVILHSTEGALAGALAALKAPGGPSAHYVVGVDGSLYQLVAEKDVGFHVAAWGNNPALNRNKPSWLPPYNGRYSACNAATIGIELVGLASQGFKPAQYESLGALVRGICDRWKLTPKCLPDYGAESTVLTHAWLQSDRTDPGALFDWGAFKSALQETDVPLTAEQTDMLSLMQPPPDGLGTNADGVRAYVDIIGAYQTIIVPDLQATVATLEAQIAATPDDATLQAQLDVARAKLAQIAALAAAPVAST